MTSNKIPRNLQDNYSEEIVAKRLSFLSEKTDVKFDYLKGKMVENSSAKGNVENFIGFSQTPIGVAGPLQINGDFAKGNFYVPLATNEGAMVASFSRGMKIASLSGGITTKVLIDLYRVNPMLIFDSLLSATEAKNWIEQNFVSLQKEVEKTSNFCRLEEQKITVLGRRLILSLAYKTGDALGANMATKATQAVLDFLVENLQIENYLIHGQDLEKRASGRNLIEGRGKFVTAEVKIPKEILEEKLKVTAKQLSDVCESYFIGYSHLVTMSNHLQTANLLAAIFIACGQDVAYVAESIVGTMSFENLEDGSLIASLTLPALLVATVGGGTNKGTSAECLSILDCLGKGKAKKFAEIVCASALCGELSLAVAMIKKDLVDAHEKLNRNRPN